MLRRAKFKESQWRELVEYYVDQLFIMRKELEMQSDMSALLAHVAVNQKHKPVIECLCADCEVVRQYCDTLPEECDCE